MIRGVLRGGAQTAVLAVVVHLVASLFGTNLSWTGLLALFGLAVLVFECLLRTTAGPVPVAPAQHRPPEPARALVDVGTVMGERELGTRTELDRTLRPRLVRLADDRLRRRHGVDRVREPGRARQLLGEGAWTVLHDAEAPLPPREVVAAAVTRIEEL